MKKIVFVCLVLTLFCLNSATAVGVEKNNVILEAPNIMPPVRYPMKTVTIPVVIADFNDEKPVTLKWIAVGRKGRKLKTIRLGKRLKSLAPNFNKRELKKILKGQQEFKSINQANAARSKLNVRLVKVNLKQAFPNLAPGQKINISAQAALSVGGQPVTLQAAYTTTYLPPLPDVSADGWFPGDGHIHSYFSQDNDDSLYSIDWVASTAKEMGLKWLIMSDHAQQLDFSTQGRRRAWLPWDVNDIHTNGENGTGKNEWESYQGDIATASGVLNMPIGAGLEMSTVDRRAPHPLWDKGPVPLDSPYDSHYLAYDLKSYVENYPNTEHTLKWGKNVEKRTGQQIIDAIDDARGFGFLSHPFSSYYPWFDNWDNSGQPTSGYTGMELISSLTGNSPNDDLTTIFNKWDELLGANLKDTLKTGKFVVGTANSDGSFGTYSYFGRNMTYVWTSGGPPTNIGQVYNALKKGQAIASTGPFAKNCA